MEGQFGKPTCPCRPSGVQRWVELSCRGSWRKMKRLAAGITALPRPAGPLSLYNTQPNLLHYLPFHFPLLFFFSCSSVSYRVGGPCSRSLTLFTLLPLLTVYLPKPIFKHPFSDFYPRFYFPLQPPPLYLCLNFFSFESF